LVMVMREAIERFLGLFEDGRGQFILELPTGYGKTTAGIEIYKLLSKGSVYPEDKVIHVLPLRAIVEDLAKRLSETLGVNKVAYQAGVIIQGVNKEPFFDADYTVTTLDSFVHNMFKFPITELYRTRRHYYIPLARIYTSGVVFDETHLFIGDDTKLTTAFLTTIKVLSKVGNPLIIMSATLTNSMKGELRKRLKDEVVIKLGMKDNENGREVVVKDDDFTSAVNNIEYNVDVVRMREVVDKAIEHLESGQRVLVIIDSREEVVRVYNELKNRGFKAGLIHSWLTRRERLDVVSNLKNYEVLVGTNAIEAGVDASFDVLITTPKDALELLQRVGRVCRYVDKPCIGNVLLIGDFEKNKKGLIDYVTKKRICWRLPFDYGDCVGYNKLLETFDKPQKSTNIRYENELEHLFNHMYIPESFLSKFFTEQNYSLVREPLIEAYTKGVEAFKRTSYVDAILDSFTIEYTRDALGKVAKCIEGLGVVGEDGAMVIKDRELLRGFAEGKYNAFTKFVWGYVINKYVAGPFVILNPGCLGGGL